jgi:3-phosphoshikimate 1-carboxyvinyltransferase
MTAQRFDPAGPLGGTITAPPDKSISHRALIFGAMADGTSRIEGCLDAADSRSTLAAVRVLGATVGARDAGGSLDIEIEGIGLRGPAGSSGELDCGNAGTLIRLISGWLAGCDGCSFVLDGDDSLRRRPMRRIADPLVEMGGEVRLTDNGTPPIEIHGAALRGGEVELRVASAQVKSCLLLAGLLASGRTTVTEPNPSRNHTERMLTAMGADVTTRRVDGEESPARAVAVTVSAADTLAPLGGRVPGDISSAAFHIVAAALVPGSEVRIEGVGLNPTRTGILDVLARMGAEIEIEPDPEDGTGEASGAVIARTASLDGVRVEGVDIPLAIDELPLIALAGCFAEGETVIADAAELRHKESDRIATVAAALRSLGADIEETDDGMVVAGSGGLEGGTIDAAGDHRVAMLGAVAGLASRRGVEVEGIEAAAVSYPGFTADLGALAGRS